MSALLAWWWEKWLLREVGRFAGGRRVWSLDQRVEEWVQNLREKGMDGMAAGGGGAGDGVDEGVGFLCQNMRKV